MSRWFALRLTNILPTRQVLKIKPVTKSLLFAKDNPLYLFFRHLFQIAKKMPIEKPVKFQRNYSPAHNESIKIINIRSFSTIYF
jgi:hypothetical protein